MYTVHKTSEESVILLAQSEILCGPVIAIYEMIEKKITVTDQ